jgi:hypothetical protein
MKESAEAITETCYACERLASTVEHCPPKSFFPEGQRHNLMTVGSCEQHNNDNSMDVEYVRNTLTTLWGVNNAGQELFESKTRGSLDRSPKLLTQTFSTMRPLIYEEQQVGVFRLDLDRLTRVFEACVRAVHYRDTQQKHLNWAIVMPRLGFDTPLPEHQKQNWTRLLEMMQAIPFAKKATANPSVFEYGGAQIQGQYLYCLFFYGSFIVYALQLTEEYAQLLSEKQSTKRSA